MTYEQFDQFKQFGTTCQPAVFCNVQKHVTCVGTTSPSNDTRVCSGTYTWNGVSYPCQNALTYGYADDCGEVNTWPDNNGPVVANCACVSGCEDTVPMPNATCTSTKKIKCDNVCGVLKDGGATGVDCTFADLNDCTSNPCDTMGDKLCKTSALLA